MRLKKQLQQSGLCLGYATPYQVLIQQILFFFAHAPYFKIEDMGDEYYIRYNEFCLSLPKSEERGVQAEILILTGQFFAQIGWFDAQITRDGITFLPPCMENPEGFQTRQKLFRVESQYCGERPTLSGPPGWVTQRQERSFSFYHKSQSITAHYAPVGDRFQCLIIQSDAQGVRIVAKASIKSDQLWTWFERQFNLLEESL